MKKMKYCENCGQAKQDSEKFCGNCGTPFQVQETAAQVDPIAIYREELIKSVENGAIPVSARRNLMVIQMQYKIEPMKAFELEKSVLADIRNGIISTTPAEEDTQSSAEEVRRFRIKVTGRGGEYAVTKAAPEDVGILLCCIRNDISSFVEEIEDSSADYYHNTGVFSDDYHITITDVESGEEIDLTDWDVNWRTENAMFEDIDECEYCVCAMNIEHGTFIDYEVLDSKFDLNKLRFKQVETRFGDIIVDVEYSSEESEDFIFMGEGYETSSVGIEYSVYDYYDEDCSDQWNDDGERCDSEEEENENWDSDDDNDEDSNLPIKSSQKCRFQLIINAKQIGEFAEFLMDEGILEPEGIFCAPAVANGTKFSSCDDEIVEIKSSDKMLVISGSCYGVSAKSFLSIKKRLMEVAAKNKIDVNSVSVECCNCRSNFAYVWRYPMNVFTPVEEECRRSDFDTEEDYLKAVEEYNAELKEKYCIWYYDPQNICNAPDIDIDPEWNNADASVAKLDLRTSAKLDNFDDIAENLSFSIVVWYAVYDGNAEEVDSDCIIPASPCDDEVEEDFDEDDVCEDIEEEDFEVDDADNDDANDKKSTSLSREMELAVKNGICVKCGSRVNKRRNYCENCGLPVGCVPTTSESSLDFSTMNKILAAIHDRKIFYGKNFNEKKLEKALETYVNNDLDMFRILDPKWWADPNKKDVFPYDVLVQVDDTVFGSATDGCVITAQKIYVNDVNGMKKISLSSGCTWGIKKGFFNKSLTLNGNPIFTFTQPDTESMETLAAALNALFNK